jgi:hypothetical protein
LVGVKGLLIRRVTFGGSEGATYKKGDLWWE